MKRLHALGTALTFAAALASVWGQVPVAQAWALSRAQESASEQQTALTQAAQSKAAETDNGDSSSDDTPSFRDDIDELLAAGDYAEGEAIAIVSPDIEVSGQSIAADVSYERIAETEGSTYEAAAGTSLPKEALAGAQDDDETVSASDVAVETYLVASSDRTTRELLELLANDPRVLDATPNYSYDSLDDETGGSDEDAGELIDDDAAEEDAPNGDDVAATPDAETSTDSALLSTADPSGDVAALSSTGSALTASGSFTPSAARDVTATADASSLQWAFNRSGSANTFHGRRSLSATLSAYGWNGTANASGIVAVLDTGIDYTHADLALSMADMSPYVAAAGGTSHGYNAVNKTAEPRDDNGHGTHVAGITAAAANGVGISGAANGAKLVAVKAGDARGRFAISNILSGYEYLKNAVRAGADIRVVNNSWSGSFKSVALNMSVIGLGKLGVLSVFASGNNAADIDKATYSAGSFTYNPYAIIVNSLDMDGSPSWFTNYGAANTDVFAPGSSILSTTRSDQSGKYVASAMRSTSSTFVTFKGAGDTLRAQSSDGTSIGSLDASAGFDDEGGCLSVSGKELANSVSVDAGSSAAERVVIEVPVDESKLSQASMVGCAVNLMAANSSNMWLEVLDAKGGFVGSSTERDVADKGNWTALSLDLASLCKKHKCQIALYHDASGRAYIKVAVCIQKAVKATAGALKIDSVGVGSMSWHYGFMSGTSMAAPLVSGLAAVMTSKIAGYTELPQSARALKAVFLISDSASKRANLSGLCFSGGEVDPSAFDNAIATDKNPYPVDVSVSDDPDGVSTLMTVTGMGFGTPEDSRMFCSIGALGIEYDVVTWTDTKIVLRLKTKFDGSDKVDIKVENKDGGTSEGLSTSVLGGGSSSTPENPSDPSKPAGSGGSGDQKQPQGSDGAGSAGTGAAASAGTTAKASSVAKSATSRKTGSLADTGDRTVAITVLVLVAGVVLVVAGLVIRRKR